jgi:hypothetical protein
MVLGFGANPNPSVRPRDGAFAGCVCAAGGDCEPGLRGAGGAGERDERVRAGSGVNLLLLARRVAHARAAGARCGGSGRRRVPLLRRRIPAQRQLPHLLRECERDRFRLVCAHARPHLLAVRLPLHTRGESGASGASSAFGRVVCWGYGRRLGRGRVASEWSLGCACACSLCVRSASVSDTDTTSPHADSSRGCHTRTQSHAHMRDARDRGGREGGRAGGREGGRAGERGRSAVRRYLLPHPLLQVVQVVLLRPNHRAGPAEAEPRDRLRGGEAPVLHDVQSDQRACSAKPGFAMDGRAARFLRGARRARRGGAWGSERACERECGRACASADYPPRTEPPCLQLVQGEGPACLLRTRPVWPALGWVAPLRPSAAVPRADAEPMQRQACEHAAALLSTHSKLPPGALASRGCAAVRTAAARLA